MSHPLPNYLVIRRHTVHALGRGLARLGLLAALGGGLAGCAGGQPVNGRAVEDFFADAHARALAAAAARGDAAEVGRLVAAGANPNAIGRDGMVPLVWAIGKRNHAGMRALLAAGADPNAAGPSGLRPLELAAGSTDPELLRILLGAKGDPNARNSGSEPLLYTAVMHKQAANVRLLVERGADVNAVDDSHQTPTQLAADTDQWDLAAFLLEHGADPTIPDRSGGTVAFTLEQAGEPSDQDLRRAYDRVHQLLLTRGVHFPAERPAAARLRAFGTDNLVDAGIARDKARRRGQ